MVGLPDDMRKAHVVADGLEVGEDLSVLPLGNGFLAGHDEG